MAQEKLELEQKPDRVPEVTGREAAAGTEVWFLMQEAVRPEVVPGLVSL